MGNTFEDVKSRKIHVTLTIDQSLFKKLKEIKEKNEVESFSPMVNKMLWDWVKKEEEKENETNI